MTTNQFIAQIRDLIAKDHLAAAVEQLQQMLEKSPKLDEAILQSARFHRIREQIRTGTVTHEEANVTQNQITAGLLEFISEIEKQGAQPEFKPEFEQAVFHISTSKNVVAGSTINAENVHIGDKIYMTGKADVPKYDFNLKLTRALVEAMRVYIKDAEELCQDFFWLEDEDELFSAQMFVCQNFIGELGKQLRKLINISRAENLSEVQKQKEYVRESLITARRCLDMVNYTLISVLWDIIKTTPKTLTQQQREVITNFFNKRFELKTEEKFHLLKTLFAVFSQNQIPFPFNELGQMNKELAEDSPLFIACSRLEDSVKSENCHDTEQHLTEILCRFAFLTQYRMASVKKIGFRQIKNGEPAYLHSYVALGIDIRYSEDAEKGRWVNFGEQTPAILLYKGDNYRDGINLFPFVIDYNALTFEQGAKICFFSSKIFGATNALDFRFLGNNGPIRIEKQDIQSTEPNLDDLMMKKESLKKLNFDCVISTFEDARNTILSENNITTPSN